MQVSKKRQRVRQNRASAVGPPRRARGKGSIRAGARSTTRTRPRRVTAVRSGRVCDVNPALKPFLIPIERLTLDPKPTRKHTSESIEGIAASLKEVGQQTPVVVVRRGRRLEVLKGNGTVQAATRLGWTDIAAVSFSKRGPGPARYYRIADNRTSELSRWDAKLLPLELSLLKQMGYDPVADMRFSPKDLLQEPKAGHTPADAVPARAKTRCQLGDLWRLGEHRLFCGDARRENDLQMLMGAERWSVMVTDPPYGVNYAGKNDFLNTIDKGNRIQTAITGDHQEPAEMERLWTAALERARAFAASGASYYITGPQGGELLLLLMRSIQASRFLLKHNLIWAKNNHVLGRCDYNYKHEPILFGWTDKGQHKFYGPAGEVSLWEVDRSAVSKLHPTMKPAWLFARAIRNSSEVGEVVLDPFLGSGTAIIAAEQMGRRCFALEIEPVYCDVALARWEKFAGREAARMGGRRRCRGTTGSATDAGAGSRKKARTSAPAAGRRKRRSSSGKHTSTRS